MPDKYDRETDMFSGVRATLRAVFGTDEHARHSRDEDLEHILDQVSDMEKSLDELNETLEGPAHTIQEALELLARRSWR